MKQSKEVWSRTTTTIFNSVLIFAICGILLPIIESIAGAARELALQGGGLLGSIGLSKTFISFSTGGGLGIFCSLLFAGMLYGWHAFSKGLTEFEGVVDPADRPYIAKMRTAVQLLLLGFGVRFILGFVILPGAIWLDNILFAVYFLGCLGGYFLMLLSFSELKNSPTFPEMARSGAGLLFIAMILLMVGPGLRLLSMALSFGFIAGVFNIVATIAGFIILIFGWSKIKSAV